MSFGAPAYLALLALPLALAALLAWWASWRVAARRRVGASGVTAWPFVAPMLLLAALAFAAFAAARPQYGDRDVQVEDRGIDLVIVLDVSQSMRAEDVAPNRLGRAQAEIVAMLQRMQGDRAGLVIFAGDTFVRSPLTADLDALARLVEGVNREQALVPPGSDLGAAIRRATDLVAAGDAETKALLIVSDGEDHGGGVIPAVASADSRGIIVYSAGAGTEGGAPVLDRVPQTNEYRPRIDQSGAPVITRLDAAALTRIADTGGGRYVELSGEGRPLAGLSSEFDSLARTTFETRDDTQPIERFQLFTAIALALAALATLLGQRVWLPRARRIARLWPLGAAGVLFGAVCASDLASSNERGNRRYAASDYAAAVEAYRTAQAIDPSRPEPYHNAGNALDRAGDFAAAVAETRRALPTTDPKMAALLEYALGNHYAGLEEFANAVEAYKRSLLADPSDEDAKHNLEVLTRRLLETPTPTATPQSEDVPTPGVGGEPGEPSPGEGSPQPGGTPQSGAGSPTAGTPPAGSEMTPEQLQRALEQALQGIDEEFDIEEAIRVLELLEDENRSRLDEPRPGPAFSEPDY